MTDTGPMTIPQEEIVSAIRAATNEVLSTMVAMEISSCEIVEPKAATSSVSGIISLIGMAGQWTGSASLACPAPFACKLSSNFLMTELQVVDEEVLDAIAEITNMIFGNVKTLLEDRLGDMGLSTPTVIFGRHFQARSARTAPWTIVRFKCAEGDLCVQMCLTPNREESMYRTTRPGFQFPHLLQI